LGSRGQAVQARLGIHHLPKALPIHKASSAG
jgi:hypothetical protein